MTLIANAGSPFSTAYAGADAAPPRFDLSEMGQNVLFYLKGTQGVTLLLAIAATALFQITFEGTLPKRCIQILIYANWICNLGFYFSHPVTAAYYTMRFQCWLYGYWCRTSTFHKSVISFPEYLPVASNFLRASRQLCSLSFPRRQIL